MARARSGLARFVARRLEAMKAKADASGHPDLNILFVLNMPFRAIAKMSAGAVSADMVASILDAVNGHPIRGLARALVGYVANARADRATQRQIDRRR